MDDDLSDYVDLVQTMRFFAPMECPHCGCVVDHKAVRLHEAWHRLLRAVEAAVCVDNCIHHSAEPGTQSHE